MRKRRHAAWLFAVAPGAALLGCPPLADIGVETDASGDREARHDHADASSEGGPEERAEAPPEGACAADLTTDPKNCGRCGHDCKGGKCAGGVCQPYVLVGGIASPYGIAVNAGTVYFTSVDGSVRSCPADDCANMLTQMTTGQHFPKRITTDATSVYWGNEGFVVPEGGFAGSIAACGLKGCQGGVPTTLTTIEDGPLDIAVDSTSVYWTDAFNGLVRSCAVAGCGGSPKTLAHGTNPTSGIAVDPTNVYWAEPKLGLVLTVPLGGGAISTVASGQDSPAGVDVAGATVYWTTNSSVMSRGVGGGPATVFAKNQTGAGPITHDSTTLYWALYIDGGKVLSCPLKGCATPTVLADMQGIPTSVAVDAESVYWTDQLTGTVMRVVK